MNIIKSIKVGMAEKEIKNQQELAKLCKINVMTISNIMTGRNSPSVETVEKISIGLGYLLSEFYALGE